MKRPHRRTHLLIWLTIAPVIAIAAILIWTQRPGVPVTELPPSINEISDPAEGQ